MKPANGPQPRSSLKSLLQSVDHGSKQAQHQCGVRQIAGVCVWQDTTSRMAALRLAADAELAAGTWRDTKIVKKITKTAAFAYLSEIFE